MPHARPIVQLEHCSALERFVALPYVPAKHASGAEAPDGQNEPGLQSKKADAAEADWKDPPGTDMHVARPRTSEKLPGEQAEGIIEPVPHAWPTVQLKHCSALDRCVALLNVPAGHARSADDPSEQYEPGTQPSHAVEPGVVWKVPPAQGAHPSVPGALAKVPLAHGWHSATDFAPTRE